MLAHALQLWDCFSAEVRFSSTSSDLFFHHVITSIPTTQCEIPTNAFFFVCLFLPLHCCRGETDRAETEAKVLVCQLSVV